MKIWTFVVGLLLLASSIFAEIPVFKWAKNINGNGNDYSSVTSISYQSKGYIYFSGTINGSEVKIGNFTLTNKDNTGSDIFIAKFDTLGNVIWAKNFGNSDNNNVQGITCDNNDNVYFVGGFRNNFITFDNFTVNHLNNIYTEGYITKLDSNGNVQWAKKITDVNGSTESPMAICFDGVNNLYVTGNFCDTSVKIGTTTLTNQNSPNQEIYVIKYDVNGNSVWAKSFGGNGNDIGMSIANDTKGNVLITGNYSSTDFKVNSLLLPNTSYSSNVFIIKLKSDGSSLWGKGIDSNDTEFCCSISTDYNDNAYWGGYFKSASIKIGNLTLTNPNPGYERSFLSKFDSDGNTIWAVKNNEATVSDYIYGISADKAGNIYTTGYKYFSAQNQGISISKYNSTGNEINSFNIANTSKQYGRGIISDSKGNIYLSGDYNGSALTLDSNTQITNSASGSSEMFLSKFYLTCNAPTFSSVYFCPNDSVVLTAPGNYDSYSWKDPTNLVVGTKQTFTVKKPKDKDIYSCDMIVTGCKTALTDTLKQYSDFSLKLTGDTVFCENDSTKLTASGATGYIWSNGKTSSSIYIKNSGKYTLTGIGSNGCKKSISLNINKLAFPHSDFAFTPPVLNKTQNTLTCVVTDPEPNTIYSWDMGDGTTENGSTIIHNYQNISNSLQYKIKLTASNGNRCSNTTLKNIIINTPNFSSAYFCANDSVTLTAPNGYTSYTWKNPNGSAVSFKQTTTIKKPIDKDIYTCEMLLSGVIVVLTDTLKQYPALNLKITGDSTFCVGDSVKLTASGANIYVWNNGKISNSIIVKNSDKYTVTGIGLNGCKQDVSINVKSIQIPKPEFSYSPSSINKKENVLSCSITNPDPNLNYSWDMGDGNTETGIDIKHTYQIILNTVQLKIILTATNKNGCSGTESKNIIILPFIPNVFTPNNDGLDDVFMSGFELKIFDRYGLQIYSGTSGWDGTYNGNLLNPDTYFYVISFTDNYGQSRSLKGYITLVR